MNEEIKLKFIVQPGLCPHYGSDYRQRVINGHPLLQLTNTYFETVGFYLLRHSIGLRIYQMDGQIEMTMKTTEQVIDGLHQHPKDYIRTSNIICRCRG
ncbi:hypothetical protein [Sodalis-like endosymbiont of Proechinophthirus fluctus]|uniref:hypothetical protein n=1 Tax=Sodalis-like endosymbiont of Proechinophthirus fluctus TaxID=1462730 RepID=UPI00082B1236|nr:hypothetical protein [Sodalis-like endosymbiont of Proechinophthirus fluctus]